MRKKTINRLKTVRVLLAIIFFTPVLLFLIDFVDLLPDAIGKIFHLQIVQAILWGAGILVVVYIMLTLLYGRFYCSMICPAGILQDIFNRLACIGKKKKNGSMRFRYHAPTNGLRYIILSVTALLAVFGFTELLLLLDPYSNFGRIAANLFRPVLIWINNLLSGILSSHGNYILYHVSVDISTAALISAIIAFLVFAVMVYFRGRLFCNTLCPVGALLSIFSRVSFYRVKIDPDTCNTCQSCERTCKAEAIDSQHHHVDMSRCVSCFNCLVSCNKKAIQYRFAPPVTFGKKQTIPTPFPERKSELTEQVLATHQFAKSRRLFIATSASLASAAPIWAFAQEKSAADIKTPVTPPGAMELSRFKKYCTGCHLCVVQCPSHVLKPAGLQFGWSYLLKPYMSYENNFCNYTCTVCSEVCPTHAIRPITEAQKKVTQIGIANFYIDKCIVHTEGTDCGACSEHCPTQAVHMMPYKGTLTIPQINPHLCIGCGGCESICPVSPDRAIVVVANDIHQTAELPPEEEVRKIDSIDFGF